MHVWDAFQIHAMNARSPTHLPPSEDLILIIVPIKLHRLCQIPLLELLCILRAQRTRPHDAHVPVDFLLMAHQARGLIEWQARISVVRALVPVDVVIPPIGTLVIIEFADLDRPFPTAVALELAHFRSFVAEVGKFEGLDLGGDVTEDRLRVRGSRRGAEDVAVGFRGVGLADCLAGRFVGGPVCSLAVLAAVFGALASAA